MKKRSSLLHLSGLLILILMILDIIGATMAGSNLLFLNSVYRNILGVNLAAGGLMTTLLVCYVLINVVQAWIGLYGMIGRRKRRAVVAGLIFFLAYAAMLVYIIMKKSLGFSFILTVVMTVLFACYLLGAILSKSWPRGEDPYDYIEDEDYEDEVYDEGYENDEEYIQEPYEEELIEEPAEEIIYYEEELPEPEAEAAESEVDSPSFFSEEADASVNQDADAEGGESRAAGDTGAAAVAEEPEIVEFIPGAESGDIAVTSFEDLGLGDDPVRDLPDASDFEPVEAGLEEAEVTVSEIPSIDDEAEVTLVETDLPVIEPETEEGEAESGAASDMETGAKEEAADTVVADEALQAEYRRLPEAAEAKAADVDPNSEPEPDPEIAEPAVSSETPEAGEQPEAVEETAEAAIDSLEESMVTLSDAATQTEVVEEVSGAETAEDATAPAEGTEESTDAVTAADDLLREIAEDLETSSNEEENRMAPTGTMIFKIGETNLNH